MKSGTTWGRPVWDLDRATLAFDQQFETDQWYAALAWLIPHGLTCESNTMDCGALA